MQIVDTLFISKTLCVDLQVSTSKTEKTEFYEALSANFGPFFNLGLLKAKSRSNLALHCLWIINDVYTFYSVILLVTEFEFEEKNILLSQNSYSQNISKCWCKWEKKNFTKASFKQPYFTWFSYLLKGHCMHPVQSNLT